MKTSTLIVLCIGLLAGCATSADCNDAYSVGRSEGRGGTFAQGELHARRCIAFDINQYSAGYRDGYQERPSLGGM